VLLLIFLIILHAFFNFVNTIINYLNLPSFPQSWGLRLTPCIPLSIRERGKIFPKEGAKPPLRHSPIRETRNLSPHPQTLGRKIPAPLFRHSPKDKNRPPNYHACSSEGFTDRVMAPGIRAMRRMRVE
jgi:hypothetical protein